MQPTHVLCPVRGDPCAFLNSRRSEAEESVFCMCACPSLSYPPSSAASAQPQSPQQQLQPRALQMRNTDAALGLGSCCLRQWKTWPWLLGRSPARRLKLLAAMRDDRAFSLLQLSSPAQRQLPPKSLLPPSIEQPRAAAAPPETGSSLPQSGSPAQRELPPKQPP